MATASGRRPKQIRDFILRNLRLHPVDITRFTADHFRISRPAVLHHINALSDEGALKISGETRGRRYELAPISEASLELPISPDLKEDAVWREKIRPILNGVPSNVLSICQYGFTEILNNAIDHSEGTTALVYVRRDVDLIRMLIVDNGIGIFTKIARDFHLDDPRHAILELAKGKLTTDPDRHTGEGVFFASRIFDRFSLLSSNLFFTHRTDGDDWLLETEDSGEGTSVIMEIDTDSARTTQEVFDRFSSGQDRYAFTRTHVPVALARYGDENLVSRSQARRLLTRFERFEEVFLDFDGIETIGQAFADEIFRVFAAEKPDTRLTYTNTTPAVNDVIKRALNPS